MKGKSIVLAAALAALPYVSFAQGLVTERSISADMAQEAAAAALAQCRKDGHHVSVTVHCAGKGLATAGRTVASVNVRCPTCGSVNQLCFEPSGTVRAVVPYTALRQMPEPSIN